MVESRDLINTKRTFFGKKSYELVVIGYQMKLGDKPSEGSFYQLIVIELIAVFIGKYTG